ncbi:hypothetical protein F1C10_14390 [Sphingomonas sp. NBWT7]|uniref:hypothetical protein n=1 Tax=Sphingomonas sp. NBWT7 TaxID=2596913 RepID=UPI001628975A|nr:hypothetical protein [Sphingomonas sp. NBWT7]QNE32991.1 hypothetical protein F1C10_14390 [Sphingomonas sp. NBWT7]
MRFCARVLAGFVFGCGLFLFNIVEAEPLFGSPRDSDRWRLTPLDVPGAATICAYDRAALLRTGMPAARCAHELIAGDRGEEVVFATCEGVGWSRSAFRPMGERVIRIETQGVRYGQPFAVDYDARWVAACEAKHQ